MEIPRVLQSNNRLADNPVIELKGVSKAFGEVPVVGSLDLTFPEGRTTALLGPSGCGKSTLLRLIIGLVEPDAGTVHIEGSQLTQANGLALRRRIGYVIQEGGLFPHLTAEGNITLLARYLGWAEDRITRRVAELAELTRFPSDGLGRYPAELSGGQRRRVALMRALMLDPDVILLDEPLGALDPMVRAELQSDLRDIFRRLGKTVVLVTHDIGEAGFFGDEIILLRAGNIVQRGSLRELVATPADPFVTEFINAQRSPLEALQGDAP
jgi:osmoprotectant transport system ATP-binding protein